MSPATSGHLSNWYVTAVHSPPPIWVSADFVPLTPPPLSFGLTAKKSTRGTGFLQSGPLRTVKSHCHRVDDRERGRCRIRSQSLHAIFNVNHSTVPLTWGASLSKVPQITFCLLRDCPSAYLPGESLTHLTSPHSFCSDDKLPGLSCAPLYSRQNSCEPMIPWRILRSSIYQLFATHRDATTVLLRSITAGLLYEYSPIRPDCTSSAGLNQGLRRRRSQPPVPFLGFVDLLLGLSSLAYTLQPTRHLRF